MTYNVFGGTLNLTQSINHNSVGLSVPVQSIAWNDFSPK